MSLPVPSQPPNARNSDERLRILFDAAPVAMIAVNQEGQIVLANREMAQTFGYEIAELMGRDIELLIPGSARRIHRTHMESFFNARVPRVMGVGREVYGLHRTS